MGTLAVVLWTVGVLAAAIFALLLWERFRLALQTAYRVLRYGDSQRDNVPPPSDVPAGPPRFRVDGFREDGTVETIYKGSSGAEAQAAFAGSFGAKHLKGARVVDWKDERGRWGEAGE
jgi:hypothetical protein